MIRDWNEIVKLANMPLTVIIDEVVEGVELYFGYALPDNDATDQPVWRIKKMVKSGSEFIFRFADGSEEFNKVWEDRATYTY